MFVFLQLLIGWLYGHFFEYAAHRWVFHNRKYFPRAFRNHYAQHHARSKRGVMVDVSAYKKISFSDFEFRALALGVLLHSPIAFWFPYFFLAIIYSAISYYYIHKRAHRDYIWGRKHLSWHYDHHMGKNSNMNWAVRLPIFDHLLRTREVYKGTMPEILRYRNYHYTGHYAIRSRRHKRRAYPEID